MNLCSDDHDEVCYESLECPACQMVRERNDAQVKLYEAEQEIKRLESEVSE